MGLKRNLKSLQIKVPKMSNEISSYGEQKLINRGFNSKTAKNISSMKRNSESKGLSKVQKLKDIENKSIY